MIDYIKERVSIIVPVYNAEKYLTTCIESILKQSYSDWELLLINDGSVDASGQICDTFASGDKRIKVFHQDNAGVSAARNRGINEAVGEFVTFVDSDDYITENHIEGLVNVMKEMKCDLSVGDIFFQQENKVWNNGWIRNDAILNVHDYIRIIKNEFPNVCIGGVCNKIFLKRIIEREGIYFNEDKSYSEDYMFNVAYLKFCGSIALVSQSSLCYRLRQEESLSKTKLVLADNLIFWENLYLAFNDLDKEEGASGRGYIRILTNCISEEMKKTGRAKDISNYLKVYYKNQDKFAYIKNAKLCQDYPYNISGILLKIKCFKTVAILFGLANRVRK